MKLAVYMKIHTKISQQIQLDENYTRNFREDVKRDLPGPVGR